MFQIADMPNYAEICECGHEYGAHYAGRRPGCGDCDDEGGTGCKGFKKRTKPAPAAAQKRDGFYSGSRWIDKCRRCHERAGWGRSPLCYFCLGEVELLVTAAGELVDPNKPARERVYAARYRFRPVRCGKPDCKREPHYWYCYRAWRTDGRAREKYLGPAEEAGDGYEFPTLRKPRAGFGL
jgi:hypothetical protein